MVIDNNIELNSSTDSQPSSPESSRSASWLHLFRRSSGERRHVEHLVNIDEGGETSLVREDRPKRPWKSANGEIYLSSQYYEPESISDPSSVETDEDFEVDTAFMGDFISYLRKNNVLEEAMGGDEFSITEDVRRVAESFLAENSEPARRPIGATILAKLGIRKPAGDL
jgi:hypothetical protein